MKLERIILANLVNNDGFRRKVVAFLKPEYFTEPNQRRLFTQITEYFQTYNSTPTEKAMSILLDKLTNISETENKESQTELGEVYKHQCTETEQWLVDETEKFCKDKALYNAIYEAIEIIGSPNKKKSKDSIPEILQKALGISFDLNVGHEYFDDADERFKYYNSKELHLPFDIDYLNKITDGGVTPKTLNVVMAPPGGGKSIFLCHVSASYLKQNKNVVYITCEMSEERIAERIDANLMDINVGDVKLLPESTFKAKLNRVKQTTKGKLIIKEYPNGTLNALQIQCLLDELKIKKNFIPDVLVIDYLNICVSNKHSASSGANSYTIVKSISEEFRAIGVVNNIPIWTATQFNRSGVDNSDPNMTNIAESMGTAHTADLMVAIVSTDELDSMQQVMIKQIKNRYNDSTVHKKFIVGLDKAKMKFFDVSEKAQSGIVNSNPTQQGKIPDKKPIDYTQWQ